MAAARILILFHSTAGATWRMAKAVAEGVTAAGAEAAIKQVPEIAEAEAIAGPGAHERRAAFADVPVAEPGDLLECDGLAVGTPVHFGTMSAALRVFFDRTGRFWMEGSLIGKPATVFTAAGSGGGRETAILATWSMLAVHGMTLVPLGMRDSGISDLSSAHGASPLGAGTVAGGPGDRPSKTECRMARTQGRALAEIAQALRRG
ncbi:MAG: NAD(P)H:quinone oxidoreductase [Bauldia litoralis]